MGFGVARLGFGVARLGFRVVGLPHGTLVPKWLRDTPFGTPLKCRGASKTKTVIKPSSKRWVFNLFWNGCQNRVLEGSVLGLFWGIPSVGLRSCKTRLRSCKTALWVLWDCFTGLWPEIGFFWLGFRFAQLGHGVARLAYGSCGAATQDFGPKVDPWDPPYRNSQKASRHVKKK